MEQGGDPPAKEAINSDQQNWENNICASGKMIDVGKDLAVALAVLEAHEGLRTVGNAYQNHINEGAHAVDNSVGDMRTKSVSFFLFRLHSDTKWK